MLRFFCWLIGHKPAPGVRRQWCIRFHCERCHRLIPGDLAPSRSRA